MARLDKEGRAPLDAFMDGRGRLVVYAAPRPDEVPDLPRENPWAHRTMFVKSVMGLRIEGDRKIERLPEEKGDLKRIREWPAAEAWRKRAPLFEGAGLRDEAAIADALGRAGDALSNLLAGPTDEVTWDEMFYSFWELADETTNRNRFNWPFIGAPIGLRLGEKSAEREGEVLWAVADVKEWLYASGDRAQRALLMNEIGDRLRYPDRLQAELRGIKGAKGADHKQLSLNKSCDIVD